LTIRGAIADASRYGFLTDIHVHSPVNKKNSRSVNNNARKSVYARDSAQKILSNNRTLRKVCDVLILDYGITTMFTNTQWSVSGIKIAHACLLTYLDHPLGGDMIFSLHLSLSCISRLISSPFNPISSSMIAFNVLIGRPLFLVFSGSQNRSLVAG